MGLVFSNQATTSNLVQIPWNFVDGFCISGNPNKGNSVIRCYQQTRPNGTLVLSSYSTYIRMLVTWLLFRSRARVVLGSELRLLMSFSCLFSRGWTRFFSPHGFPRFLGFDSKAVQRSALCRSRRELSNEYLLAKIGVDTAENEPCKVCPLSAYRSPRCPWANTEKIAFVDSLSAGTALLAVMFWILP